MTDIRPQYHFRPSPAGLRAWDVRRLIRLAAPLAVVDVPLSQIAELDEDWWFQHGGRPSPRAIVDHWRLASEADLAYPVLFCAEGRLMDGMHRVARALLEGRVALPAKRFAQTPEPDYVSVAPEDLPYD